MLSDPIGCNEAGGAQHLMHGYCGRAGGENLPAVKTFAVRPAVPLAARRKLVVRVGPGGATRRPQEGEAGQSRAA